MSSTSTARDGLCGKIAMVTGSTDGIGLDIARRLGLDGCKVVVSSRKEANVDRAKSQLMSEGIDVIGVACNVGLDGDRRRLVETTVETFGGIDILVNNAAANPFFGHILDCSEAQWDKIFDTNVKGPFLLTQLAAPEMEKREGGGAVVIVASLAGLNPFPFLGPYSVSKTALLGLTKALAAELAPRNIRVNCIAPGIIDTKFASALTGNEEAMETTMAFTPMKRVGATRDVSGVASFLCSEDAAYITGETIVVAGGAPSRL